MIESVIFDMDGLLLDSEPFWKEAETEVFNSLGVPLTHEMCDTTVGMRIEEVTKHWNGIYPWDTDKKGQSPGDVNKRVIDKVILLIKNKGVPFDGVNYILNFFSERKIKMAIASSSAVSIINAVIDKFNIRGYFDVISSAENEEFGKPHPAIYLKTAGMLGATPDKCLAFEDSFNGLKSAKAAGMKTVAIPEARFYNEVKFDIADIKLASLNEFDSKHMEILNKL